MPANKTQSTGDSVSDFLESLGDPQQRLDSYTLLGIMSDLSQSKPVMWGESGKSSIIGFGSYHYKYKSGREGDWFLVGFAPRKQSLSIYLSCDLSSEKLGFEGLGHYKKGKGCLYIKRLSQVNMAVLQELIRQAIQATQGYARSMQSAKS